MDGQQQRKALNAAERAINALGSGDHGAALTAAQQASELDQVGLFAALPHAVGVGAADLERTGAVGASSWDAIHAAVGPGPLAALVDGVRRQPKNGE